MGNRLATSMKKPVSFSMRAVVLNIMSVCNTDTTMGPPFDVQVTGEPRDTETVTRGSERGRWKSTHQGNSLASYSTTCAVLEQR
jgi:hypothetical protein